MMVVIIILNHDSEGGREFVIVEICGSLVYGFWVFFPDRPWRLI